mmetsp:Transcript_103960/g.318482  ORF Transcript_103960/g.318482 Transcript_103960/m.318482 type:complete len:212 (-) Transcript_103960:12-647(-)
MQLRQLEHPSQQRHLEQQEQQAERQGARTQSHREHRAHVDAPPQVLGLGLGVLLPTLVVVQTLVFDEILLAHLVAALRDAGDRHVDHLGADLAADVSLPLRLVEGADLVRWHWGEALRRVVRAWHKVLLNGTVVAWRQPRLHHEACLIGVHAWALSGQVTEGSGRRRGGQAQWAQASSGRVLALQHRAGLQGLPDSANSAFASKQYAPAAI